MITIFDRIGRTFIRLFEQTGLWFDALWRTFAWTDFASASPSLQMAKRS